jgi:hypothetical protein
VNEDAKRDPRQAQGGTPDPAAEALPGGARPDPDPSGDPAVMPVSPPDPAADPDVLARDDDQLGEAGAGE